MALQMIANPINKMDMVINSRIQAALQSGQAARVAAVEAFANRYMSGQKTSRGIFHTIPLVANQTSYTFFSQGLTNNTLGIQGTNMGKNTLDAGNMLLIDHINLQIITLNASGGYECTNIQSIENGGANNQLPNLATGTLSLTMNQATVIDRFPLTEMLPRFNPDSAAASAVIASTTNAAAGTAITYGQQQTGQSFLAMQTPLILDELVEFGVTLQLNGTYAIPTNGYIRCTLAGLGVLPNPGLV